MNSIDEKRRKIKYIAIIIIAVVLYIVKFILYQPKVFLNTDSDKEIGCTDMLINGSYVEQCFYADHDFEMALQLCVITWNINYNSDDKLIVSIVDKGKEEIINSAAYRADGFTDHELSRFLIYEGIKLQKGNWYAIRIESNITDESRPIAIATVENTLPDITKTICNGRAVDYNLRMKICE